MILAVAACAFFDRRSHPAVATLCGKLYVSGGFDGAERQSEACVEIQRNLWIL